MTHGEGFECGHHEHAAAHFRRDVQIIGDLQVVDDSLEHFIHFAVRSQQTLALEAVGDVVFRLMAPGALRLQRGIVIGVL